MNNSTFLWFLRILSMILIITSITSLAVSAYMFGMNSMFAGGVGGSIGPKKPLYMELATKGDVIEVQISVGDIKNITNISIYFDGEKIKPNIVNEGGVPVIDNTINTNSIGIHIIKVVSPTNTWCNMYYKPVGISQVYAMILFIYMGIGIGIQIYIQYKKRKIIEDCVSSRIR